jgi:adenylosuccinate synthase
VLDPCQRVLAAVAYRYRGSLLRELPLEPRVLAALEPVYEERPGWLSPTEGLRAWEDLPAQARDYLAWLQDLTGSEVSLVSTGPRREETIVVEASCLTRWFPGLWPLPVS